MGLCIRKFMAETSAPLLLTDDGNVRWQACTLRECGKDERFLEKVIGTHPQLLGLEDRRTNVRGPPMLRSISSGSTRRKDGPFPSTSSSLPRADTSSLSR